MELPELAIVVGGASGLTRGRLGGAGHLGAAVAAALVTLVAVAIGMILAAEAVISSAGSTSFVNAVTTINRSSLGPIWARTGLAGVALGAAGVVVALAAVLLIPGRRSTTA
jgi:hypothetical protein